MSDRQFKIGDSVIVIRVHPIYANLHDGQDGIVTQVRYDITWSYRVQFSDGDEMWVHMVEPKPAPGGTLKREALYDFMEAQSFGLKQGMALLDFFNQQGIKIVD